MARRGGTREPAADAEMAEMMVRLLADSLGPLDGPVRQQVAEGLRELGAVDRAVYSAVAGTPTPHLDEPLRRLSNAANNSLIWLAIAGGCAVAGGSAGVPSCTCSAGWRPKTSCAWPSSCSNPATWSR